MKKLFLLLLSAFLVASPTVNAAQINRLHGGTITNGAVVNADDLGEEFDQLVNESNSKEERLDDIESNNLTIAGVKTFSGAVNASSTLSVTGAATLSSTLSTAGLATFSAAIKPTQSADPVSLSNGMIWYNTTSNILKAYVNGTTATLATSGFPSNYRGDATPVYASTTTFTQSYLGSRDSTNTVDISKSTSTTEDIATTGLNGLAQSAVLTGSVAVTSGAASVTGTGTALNTDYVVGDVICITDTSECRRITVVGGATSLTVESNWGATDASSTFRRGGRAPNTHYYLYSVTNTTTPGLLLSTRNVVGGSTLNDLPSGYTYYRQQAFSILTDSTANSAVIVPFRVAAGWPNAPKVIYSKMDGNNVAPYRVLTNGASTSFAAVALTSIVPATSRLVDLSYTSAASTGPAAVYLRETGSGTTDGRPVASRANASSQWMIVPDMPTDSSQSIDYKVGDNTMSLGVYGYTVTAF